MEKKHTPAPWIWTDRFTTSEGEPCMTLLGADDTYGILCTDGMANAPHGIGDEANALLIAAAPELLEVCIATERLLDPMTNNPASEDFMVTLRAAIAKATGTK